MDEALQISVLKRWLLDDVAEFTRRKPLAWKRPIVATVQEMRIHRWPAVFFGGTLRSILLGRLLKGRIGRPRDIDIVVGGPSVGELEKQFESHVVRKTRFGGLHLRRAQWEFDIWPVSETYAFRNNHSEHAEFRELPFTTFFNLEAIAVDVWAAPGYHRNLYTANDSFFTGILRQEIEINKEDNPYPELCFIRSLVLAASLRWKIGPRLLQYLAKIGPQISKRDLESVQMKHYGRIELPSKILLGALSSIRQFTETDPFHAFRPFFSDQLTLWPEDASFIPRIRLRALSVDKKRCSITQNLL